MRDSAHLVPNALLMVLRQQLLLGLGAVHRALLVVTPDLGRKEDVAAARAQHFRVLRMLRLLHVRQQLSGEPEAGCRPTNWMGQDSIGCLEHYLVSHLDMNLGWVD